MTIERTKAPKNIESAKEKENELKIPHEEMRVRLTFTEEVLGTSSNDPELHDRYIASQAPDAMTTAEEVAAIGAGDMIERQMTVFPRDENYKPFMWNYQIKGFFKDSCKSLRDVEGTESTKITAYKSKIDGLIFIKERKIPFLNCGQVGECQRPLRADTPKGARTALAHSETIKAGASIEFTIQMLKRKDNKFNIRAAVTEWLDYGALRGLGQWRNSGKGTFEWEIIES